MMVESTVSPTPGATTLNALAVGVKANSGIVCENCHCTGHLMKNCWARGSGSEGKGPCWYKAPKGLEPLNQTPNAPMTAVATTMIESWRAGGSNAAVAAATIYQFNEDDFGGTNHCLHCTTSPDFDTSRLGREAPPVLSNEVSNTGSVEAFAVPPNVNSNSVIPLFIDSGATHWCIRAHQHFISYTPVKAVGRLAKGGEGGLFVIADHH
ncbi:hypothetical protein GYMLUDRAFT_243876 [Collybiopsis luxurians FD-317 M1]|uniref:CCHC-type domain-containing protein n=1 Tax=Collybiopsis luxurians FD-317 M1 TaxID=944289 RepID=A0A0D0CF78_9AGAR|nr:hypothetical protein GYMLUDRAFT_243876 [Collybiopsis luxurians FD-317 M1]